MKKAKNSTTPTTVYFAYATLAVITVFICVNTVFLSKTISNLEEKAKSTKLEVEAFENLYSDFLKTRTYLSISVDHDDIASVEAEFHEIRGALAIGDKESAAIAKSRLCGALSHLGRLSGFNIDSII